MRNDTRWQLPGWMSIVSLDKSVWIDTVFVEDCFCVVWWAVLGCDGFGKYFRRHHINVFFNHVQNMDLLWFYTSQWFIGFHVLKKFPGETLCLQFWHFISPLDWSLSRPIAFEILVLEKTFIWSSPPPMSITCFNNRSCTWPYVFSKNQLIKSIVGFRAEQTNRNTQSVGTGRKSSVPKICAILR